MAPRNFATEFLLRELLSALGAPLTASKSNNDTVDSFSESLSEESESQAVMGAANSQSRVMLVRRTNSSRQTVTLVDRQFDVEAFIPSHVSAALLQERGYQTLGRLRGSVVRVSKYHFATLTRCLTTDHKSTETSVSAPNVNRGNTRVYLWVDAMAIVEDNELAVQSRSEVYRHPGVAERLDSLSDAELEKQLMINQGLPPLRTTQNDRFDDNRPLLEEDCVIPEDQEQELEEQDDWGLPATIGRQPTDSELIEENESQVTRGPASPDKVNSTQDSMASSGNLSVPLSGNPTVTLSGDSSVGSSLDSRRFQFQQENIRETFVAGSDLSSSDTDGEDDGLQETKDSTPNTSKSKQQNGSNMKLSAQVSPTQATPTRNPWAIVDLTDGTPEKAPRTLTSQNKKTPQKELEEQPKVEVDENENSGAAEPIVSAHSLQLSETQSQQKSYWKTIRNFASNLFTAEDFHQPSDEEQSAEIDLDATQILDQPKEKEEQEDAEDKFAQPEEFMSSQATVVLQYAMDNDEDANAFEYEGVISDDMASPRSVVHDHDGHTVDEMDTPPAEEDTTDDLTLTEEGAEVVVTPQKRPESEEDNTGFKTPSPSAHVATPGTEKRAEIVASHTPIISTTSTKAPARRTNHPASPRNSKEPVLPTDPSGQLSPVKSPSKLVISVGPSGNSSNEARRTGFSATVSRGSKRRYQQDNVSSASATASHADTPIVSQIRLQDYDRRRTKTQKRRRREIITASYEGGSQSPQFEQQTAPLLPRRRLQSDRGAIVADNYSLDAVCRSLGSNVREQVNEEDQYSSRQPRRAWKRYESLFPPLNMTRLKQMMAESKD